MADSFHERFMLTLVSSRFGSGPVPGRLAKGQRGRVAETADF